MQQQSSVQLMATQNVPTPPRVPPLQDGSPRRKMIHKIKRNKEGARRHSLNKKCRFDFWTHCAPIRTSGALEEQGPATGRQSAWLQLDGVGVCVRQAACTLPFTISRRDLSRESSVLHRTNERISVEKLRARTSELQGIAVSHENCTSLQAENVMKLVSAVQVPCECGLLQLTVADMNADSAPYFRASQEELSLATQRITAAEMQARERQDDLRKNQEDFMEQVRSYSCNGIIIFVCHGKMAVQLIKFFLRPTQLQDARRTIEAYKAQGDTLRLKIRRLRESRLAAHDEVRVLAVRPAIAASPTNSGVHCCVRFVLYARRRLEMASSSERRRQLGSAAFRLPVMRCSLAQRFGSSPQIPPTQGRLSQLQAKNMDLMKKLAESEVMRGVVALLPLPRCVRSAAQRPLSTSRPLFRIRQVSRNTRPTQPAAVAVGCWQASSSDLRQQKAVGSTTVAVRAAAAFSGLTGQPAAGDISFKQLLASLIVEAASPNGEMATHQPRLCCREAVICALRPLLAAAAAEEAPAAAAYCCPGAAQPWGSPLTPALTAGSVTGSDAEQAAAAHSLHLSDGCWAEAFSVGPWSRSGTPRDAAAVSVACSLPSREGFGDEIDIPVTARAAFPRLDPPATAAADSASGDGAVAAAHRRPVPVLDDGGAVAEDAHRTAMRQEGRGGRGAASPAAASSAARIGPERPQSGPRAAAGGGGGDDVGNADDDSDDTDSLLNGCDGEGGSIAPTPRDVGRAWCHHGEFDAAVRA